ncbi:MAG: restriction endonuclease subunit S, partial [Myxococcales bacterium]|nr:restriction endonuclease subunit S [Myxococcales bacterium]
MKPQDLIAAFETLADAPDGVTRLRELVLQLAVRGKLVPQDPKDEPASVLLERIAAETTRLVKEGKSRKSTPLPPIVTSDVPYEVPSGWEWARFATIARIASNLVKPDAYPAWPHIAPNHIDKGTGRLLPFGTVAEDAVTSSKHRFFAGQILYSKIRPNLSKAVLVDFDGLCSADMYPLDALIAARYLHLFILSPPFIDVVTQDDNRLAMPKVNQEQLSLLAVPVPPLAEQHRIVARVDELMGLLDRLEAARDARDATRVALRDAALAELRDADDAETVQVAWARIAEHMDDLFTHPDDVAPLRQTILQLAVRGRLVPQDP